MKHSVNNMYSNSFRRQRKNQKVLLDTFFLTIQSHIVARIQYLFTRSYKQLSLTLRSENEILVV